MFKKKGLFGKGGPFDNTFRAVDKATSAAGRQLAASVSANEHTVFGEHMNFQDAASLRSFLNGYTSPDKIDKLTKTVLGYADKESFLSFYFGKAMNEVKKLADGESIESVSKWPIQAFLIIADHLKSQNEEGKITWFLNEVNRRKGGEFDPAQSLLSVMQQWAVKDEGESFELAFPEYEVNAEGVLVKKSDSSAKFKLSGEVFEVIPEVIVDPKELIDAQIVATRAELALATARKDALQEAESKALLAGLELQRLELDQPDEADGNADPVAPAPVLAPVATMTMDLSAFFKEAFTPVIEPGWTDVESTIAAAAKVDYMALDTGKNMASGAVAPKDTHTIKLIDDSGVEHDVNISCRIAEGRQYDVEVWLPNGEAEGLIAYNLVGYGRLQFDDQGVIIAVDPGLQNLTFLWNNGSEPSSIGFDYGLSATYDEAVTLAGDAAQAD
jgi:hypothetical protein